MKFNIFLVLIFLFQFLFSICTTAQIDENIPSSKEDSLNIVAFNDYAKENGIFGEDAIYFNKMINRLDSLHNEDQKIRESIIKIQNRNSKAALIHNYAIKFDSNYSKVMNFISENIRISGILPSQSLDYLMQKQALKNTFQNDANLNQLLYEFYRSNQLEDCNFFFKDSTNFDNDFFIKLVISSKNISQEIIIKYKYLSHEKFKISHNIEKTEKLDCHIKNLKLILEEMLRMKYITNYEGE